MHHCLTMQHAYSLLSAIVSAHYDSLLVANQNATPALLSRISCMPAGASAALQVLLSWRWALRCQLRSRYAHHLCNMQHAYASRDLLSGVAAQRHVCLVRCDIVSDHHSSSAVTSASRCIWCAAGAARVALGPEVPVVFTNSDDTWAQLEAAAKQEVRRCFMNAGI